MVERISDTSLLFVGETGKTGLHARSSAHLIRWTAGLDARLTITSRKKRLTFTCNPPSPGNFYRLSAMGVRPGETVEISAEGPMRRKRSTGRLVRSRKSPRPARPSKSSGLGTGEFAKG